jgi:hypothetical protein
MDDILKTKAATILSISIVTMFVYLFINLGNILDISQRPSKADAIVVFGGDWNGYRVKKALSLYREKFSNIIILNEDSQIDVVENGVKLKTETAYLLHHNISENQILYLHHAGNTMYELRALKKIAQKYGFKKLLLISAPPHLRRLKILAHDAAEFHKSNISLIFTGSDAPWWHKKEWYNHRASRTFVISETIKIVSNYTAYVILQKHGLLNPLRKYFGPAIQNTKNLFQTILRKL